MKLENLDDAMPLRNYRLALQKMRQAALSDLVEINVWVDGGFKSVSSQISIMPLRDAIALECTRQIADHDAKLRALGVDPGRDVHDHQWRPTDIDLVERCLICGEERA